MAAAASGHDSNATQSLLHGEDSKVRAVVKYQGIEEDESTRAMLCHVEIHPSQRSIVDNNRLSNHSYRNPSVRC